VVSKCGMPLGYEVFEGNRNDIGLIVSINRLPLRKSPQCASVPNVGDPLAMATGSR
jgi:transposase